MKLSCDLLLRRLNSNEADWASIDPSSPGRLKMSPSMSLILGKVALHNKANVLIRHQQHSLGSTHAMYLPDPSASDCQEAAKTECARGTAYLTCRR